MSEAAQEKDTKTIQDGLKSLMETIDEKPKTALANRENIFSFRLSLSGAVVLTARHGGEQLADAVRLLMARCEF